MAALVSPGISITVTDESQYLPSAVATVPFVVFATAQDKVINGAIAAGTTKANANKIVGVTSQRELVSLFGTPTFQQSSAGTPIYGGELNEYGLMAAYSALGVGNRVWALRADIDLAALEGTSVRPTGAVADETNWHDYANTDLGIYEFDALNNVFNKVTPSFVITNLITDTVLDNGIYVPKQSIGAIGNYAVVVGESSNRVFYKKYTNTWELVGSQGWQESRPVITGTLTTMPVLSSAITFDLNGVSVLVPPASTFSTIVGIVNGLAITGVTAGLVGGALAFYADETAMSNGSTPDGAITISDIDPTTQTGYNANDLVDYIGIGAATYYGPILYFGKYTQQPAWSYYDATPRPSGSIWVKTSATGGGAVFDYKRYNATLGTWNQLTSPLYQDGFAALYGLDPVGGGLNIASGSVFVRYDTDNTGTLSYKAFNLAKSGAVSVTGSTTTPVISVPAGTPTVTFDAVVSASGSASSTTYNISITGSSQTNTATSVDFVNAINAANIPSVSARLATSGAIVISHATGGIISLINTSATGYNPITDAGFTASTAGVTADVVDGSINLSNWEEMVYTVSADTPFTSPEDGTLWYYNDPTEVDIMVCDTAGWKGYKNVSRDVRGYNLADTDPNGVIVSASQPTTQTDLTSLVPGDLWLDTSDLENYPALYRYNNVGKWEMIDKSDQISQNGIIFADARWDGLGTADPIGDAFPSVATLQTIDDIDLDAPDYQLYPRGTLLFNTRRSGFNVKRYSANYFNAEAYPNSVLPAEAGTWVSESGLQADGSMYAGHNAQRALIVAALKAAVDSNLDIREEAYNFNLLAAPGYPELAANLVALNNDRANTGFIIGDTPMDLPANLTAITQYELEQTTRDPYLALYYPAALANDLDGNEIAVPASHIMLRTMIRNDNVAYQWFAPAGTRRGLVDNASALGYVDAQSGEFVKTGIGQGLRDALYEMDYNPITLIQGTGMVVYGQKTRNPVASSMDRINVARLTNYLRVVFRGLANQFLFEPNDKITRDQVKQAVESICNDLISKRGIYDYLVVCDTSNNTSDRIARNELYCDVAIEPMKAVEFIYVPIRLKNPGAIAAGL